jgi:Leucine-rich repeat (LRR) protein
LEDLYYLSVNKNQLTELPETLLQATELKYIRADDNQLTDLPSSFS